MSPITQSREQWKVKERKWRIRKVERAKDQREQGTDQRIHQISQNTPGSSSRHMDSKKKNMKNSKDPTDSNVPGRDTRPCFIKVIAHNVRDSHSLTIPTNFVKHLPKPMSKEAILNGPSGDSWKITMSHNEANMVMQQGWNQFYQDHSLGSQNELLLFKHNGNMSFDVQIFGKSGLQLPMTRKRKDSIKEEEETDVNIGSSCSGSGVQHLQVQGLKGKLRKAADFS